MRRWRFVLPLVALACLRPAAGDDPLDALLAEARSLEASLLAVAVDTDPVRDAVNAGLLRTEAVLKGPYLLVNGGPYLTTIKKAPGWLEAARYFLGQAHAGRSGFEAAYHGIVAVRSPIDEGLVYYRFTLPRSYYSSTRGYPCHLRLHAAGVLRWKQNWLDGVPRTSPSFGSALEEIEIEPCGRGGNSYSLMGERAVLECLEHALSRFRIDPDRVVVGGASMGGTGGWRLCGLYPDLFAAGYSITGGDDYGLTRNHGLYDGGLMLCNYANLGFCIWDTPWDSHYTANHGNAIILAGLAADHPGYYSSVELTDPRGGHGVIAPELKALGWEFLRSFRRPDWPLFVQRITHSHRYGRGFWLDLEPDAPTASEGCSASARFDPATSTCTVATTRCAGVRLDFRRAPAGASGAVTLLLDGQAFEVARENCRFRKSAGAWERADADSATAGKRRGLSGPIQDFFMEHPIALVPGNAGTERAEQIVSQLLGKPDGDRIHYRMFPSLPSSDDDLLSQCNLLVVGRPEENSFLAAIAPQLAVPIAWEPGGVRVRGVTYPSADVLAILPNPLNPDRYLLLAPSGFLGTKTTFLRYQDFAVVRPSGSPPREKIVTQGYWTDAWQ